MSAKVYSDLYVSLEELYELLLIVIYVLLNGHLNKRLVCLDCICIVRKIVLKMSGAKLHLRRVTSFGRVQQLKLP